MDILLFIHTLIVSRMKKFKLNLFRNGFLTEEFSLNIVQTAEKTELPTAGGCVRA